MIRKSFHKAYHTSVHLNHFLDSSTTILGQPEAKESTPDEQNYVVVSY